MKKIYDTLNSKLVKIIVTSLLAVLIGVSLVSYFVGFKVYGSTNLQENYGYPITATFLGFGSIENATEGWTLVPSFVNFEFSIIISILFVLSFLNLFINGFDRKGDFRFFFSFGMFIHLIAIICTRVGNTEYILFFIIALAVFTLLTAFYGLMYATGFDKEKPNILRVLINCLSFWITWFNILFTDLLLYCFSGISFDAFLFFFFLFVICGPISAIQAPFYVGLAFSNCFAIGGMLYIVFLFAIFIYWIVSLNERKRAKTNKQ